MRLSTVASAEIMDEIPPAESCPRCDGPMAPVQVAGPNMTMVWEIIRFGEDGCCTECAWMEGADEEPAWRPWTAEVAA